MVKDDLFAAAIQFLLHDAHPIGVAVQAATRESDASELGELSELADDLAKRALGSSASIYENLRAARDGGNLPGHVFNDWMWLRSARNLIRHDKSARLQRDIALDRHRAREVFGRIVRWYATQLGKSLPTLPEVANPSPPSHTAASLGSRAVKSAQADNLDDVLLVAFYLAKFEHDALRLGNQGETFEWAADHLGVKSTTLKNHRDRFDPHIVPRKRRGWWQAGELVGTARAVFEEWNSKPEGETRDAVNQILGLEQSR